MTRSVYIIGGAGTGKSTFTAELLKGHAWGPLEDLYALRNRKALVTLRGHRLSVDGLYLGVHRDSFPGSDGLDRASSPTAVAWLAAGNLPSWIIGEGATLATRPFLTALAGCTDLLILHLTVDPFIADLRFAARGSNQNPGFVENTVTRSANLANHLRDVAEVVTVDTGDEEQWAAALSAVRRHLGRVSSSVH